MLRSLVVTVLAFNAVAQAQEYVSPNSRKETCHILAPMPNGKYAAKDQKQEQKLCNINFYDAKIALCPKTWSTSAAIMIYNIEKEGLSPAAFESQKCAARIGDKLGKFKMTMNQSGTSGTTSTSSLLYYHFSRYLDTMIDVPVAVLRTIDKDVMNDRVAVKAKAKGAMNRSAWDWIKKATKTPDIYKPTDDIFTKDRQQFYGVLLNDKGERYGAEINSARKAGWGAPQVKEFQTTAAFTALRTQAPIAKVTAGNKSYSAVQMAYWMRELSEIAVLDHIFSQQDRVGNIDFQWHWYWVDAQGNVTHRKSDSKVAREKMSSIAMPEDIKAFNPVLLQRTLIGDNDAGGSPRYANFSKKTGMVAGLRHFNSSEYNKLQALSHDFQSKGPILNHIKSNFGLTDAQLKMVVNNTVEVAAILNKNCKAGVLLFDLNPTRFIKGDTAADTVDCDAH